MANCCSSAGCEEEVVENSREWLKLGLGLLVSGQSMVFGLAVNLSPPEGTARTVLHSLLAFLAVLVFVLVGGGILRGAWKAMLEKRVVVEQLFLLGILGAFFGSVQASLTGQGDVYYEIVAVLTAIYTFGTVIGQKRKAAALASASALEKQFSKCRVVTCCGEEKWVDIEEVETGDRVLVMPGDGVPVDGKVLEGGAYVKEAALTGEPFPVVKREGDLVYAGSYVLDHKLLVEATVTGKNRQLDTVMEAVRKAQENPSTLQREADRLVGYFLPIVIGIALITLVVWTLLDSWQLGTLYGLAVLLIACPCAMGLATPIGIWSAIGALASRGIVVNSGEMVERLAGVTRAVFDKTGTLSEEQLQVVDFITVEGESRELMKRRIGSLQAELNHPVAKAFQDWKPEQICTVENVTLLAAKGVTGKVDGIEFVIGNQGVLENEKERQQAEDLRQKMGDSHQASHEFYVKQNGVFVGLVTMRERLRESAQVALDLLERAGIEVSVMTGDRKENAEANGLRNVTGGMTPEGKAAMVEALQKNGEKVLFVGDGINDSVAMGKADASLAMAEGTDLAGSVAGGKVFGGNLLAVAESILLCRQVRTAIRRNILYAASYNFIGVLLAAFGLLHPVIAALIMMVSSVSVTWRALRYGASLLEDKSGELQEVQEIKKSREREEKRRQARLAQEQQGVAGIMGENWRRGMMAVAIMVQGGILWYLGNLGVGLGLALTVVFILCGAGVWVWYERIPKRRLPQMGIGMFGFGNLAMLFGWWVDSGFAAVVQDGMCLCGCPKSTLGYGVLAAMNWMNLSMVAASMPMLVVPDGQEKQGVWRRRFEWLACVGGMLVGMWVGAFGMTQIPVVNGQMHFLWTFLAMSVGMIGGMLIVCRCISGRKK